MADAPRYFSKSPMVRGIYDVYRKGGMSPGERADVVKKIQKRNVDQHHDSLRSKTRFDANTEKGKLPYQAGGGPRDPMIKYKRERLPYPSRTYNLERLARNWSGSAGEGGRMPGTRGAFPNTSGSSGEAARSVSASARRYGKGGAVLSVLPAVISALRGERPMNPGPAPVRRRDGSIDFSGRGDSRWS